jgi:neopullulanase
MSLLSFLHLGAPAQTPDIQRIEPPFWWVGMKNPELQLMVHGKDLAQASVSVSYPGVRLAETVRTDNPNYLFITLHLAPGAKPGLVPLVFGQGKQARTVNYEVRAKSAAQGRIQGFDQSDLIYLLMPDRFANGDPTNDQVAGMLEKPDRKAPFGRHGGDLQGVINQLDYLKDLGTTALWLNPVLENDMPASSYHGYAITDFYRVDRRFGDNDAYLKLIDQAHQRGLKVIQDMVANHIGSSHWWMKDLPAPDWVHQFPEFTRSNYRLAVISDPHASQADSTQMTKGWFDTTMPDLNQNNRLLAQYLIQNTLWWIEYSGIDGIRMDTYPYPDKDFMARWVREVLQEYPQFNIVGEVWIHSAAISAYWLKNTFNRDGYQSTLPSLTDFPVYEAVTRAFNEPTGWADGLSRLYHVLAEDFVYEKPENNVIFLDNHDVSRYFTSVKQNPASFKMGLAFLLTMRGIPQVYYGTEIMMPGDGGFHPDVRKDFPGGWPGDAQNAFRPEGRTPAQNEAFNYLRTLANWRKTARVVHHGKLTHFLPENDTYVYFRHNERECVMVVFNNSDQPKTLTTKRFAEVMAGYTTARNVLTGEQLTSLGTLALPAKSATVLELGK